MIGSLGNLATACDNIPKGTPSGVILDPKTINKAVLFVAATPPPGGIVAALPDLLTTEAATLRDAVKVNLDFIRDVTATVAEIKLYRLERVNLKDTTKVQAFQGTPGTDPAADEIIRQRDELCKLQDKFLKNMADNFQDPRHDFNGRNRNRVRVLETLTITKTSRPCFQN